MDATQYLHQIILPSHSSHKGENGKLLIIGGSELFHAASAWSLSIASKLVDLVFYSSVTENNTLLLEAKQHFWEGIVVPRGHILQYIDEAECILIGPGMTRDDHRERLPIESFQTMKTTDIDWEHDTYAITNYLLAHYGTKKWVVDAGALQMIEPELITSSMILTPHQQEFQRVFKAEADESVVLDMSKQHNHCVLVVKGPEDLVTNGTQTEHVTGGNEGMTKGGTGDVLAGLIASFYCKNDAFASAVVGSYVNKKAGDELYKKVGPFFNSTDLVAQIPATLNTLFKR